MAKDNKQMEMETNMDMDFNFDELIGEVFGKSVAKVKLSPQLAGKQFIFYGSNSLGKTKQASRLSKYTLFVPFEAGTNAISQGNILRTSTWSDFRGHVRKLTTNKKMLDMIEQGRTVVVVCDGLEVAAMMAKQYVCDQANVETIQKIPHGAGWATYEKEVLEQVTKLSKSGFTVVWIGHAGYSKEAEDYLDLKVEWRVSLPIKNAADFTFYIEGNGVDENGNVIPSSAYLAEHLPTEDAPGFFARSRFPYVQNYFPVFDADIIKQAIYDGIVKQAEIEGAELVTFKEANVIYESAFELNFEEAMNKIYDMLDECDAKGLQEDADNVLLKYLDKVDQLNSLSKTQMQTIQAIHDELGDLLTSLEQE